MLIFTTVTSNKSSTANLIASLFDLGLTIKLYLLVSNKAININLTDLFALNRSFLTTQYTNDPIPNGDSGQQFVQNADELWVCVVDANIPTDYTGDIVWANALTANASPSYSDSRASALNNLNSQIYLTLSTQEV